MRGVYFLLAWAVLGAAAAAADGANAVPSAAIEKLTVDVVVAPDRTSLQTIHAEQRANNEAGALQIGRANIGFNAGTQQVEVVEAYTLKADGRKIAVAPNTIYEQIPPEAAQNAAISDIRVKVVFFPQFAAGDTAVYTVRMKQSKPAIENAFWFGAEFARTSSFKEVRQSVTAPTAMKMQVESHDVEFSKRQDGENTVYAWHYSAPNPKPAETYAVSALDREPRFFISSFRDYAELGHSYAAASAAKIVVTPKIKELADQIVKDATDRREQTRLIYEWVAKNIRYVAIELGHGNLIPHDVDAIVANGYGDCKDHDVLLQALLKAKGIAAVSVLLNSGAEYALTKVPTFLQLNHVITRVPEFDLYLDSSVSAAPFGILPIDEYGKPAVYASLEKPSLGSIPTLPAGVDTVSVTTLSKLDSTGVLTGMTKTVASGPSAIALRFIGLGIQQLGGDAAASAILRSLGYQNATGTMKAYAPLDASPSYTVSATYSSPGWEDKLTGKDSFLLPGGLRTLGLTGDGPMGPFYAGEMKDSEPTACFSTHQIEDLSLTAPDGVKFSTTPSDTRVETPNLLFTAHWSLTGNTLSVHREFVSKIGQPLCSGKIRKESIAALKQISDSYETQLNFSRSMQSLNEDIKRNPDDVQGWLSRGIDFASKGDHQKAIDDYNEVSKRDPNNFWAYYNRSIAYSHLNQNDLALKDIEKALELNPNDADAVAERGYLNLVLKRFEPAIRDLKKSVALKPDNPLPHYNLATLYAEKSDFANAVAEYGEAIKYDPNNYDPYLKRGQLYLEHGDDRNALKDFDQAIALKKDSGWMYGTRAQIHWRRHEHAQTLADCNKAIEFGLKASTIYLIRADARRALGDTKGANQDTSMAMKLDPSLAAALAKDAAANKH